MLCFVLFWLTSPNLRGGVLLYLSNIKFNHCWWAYFVSKQSSFTLWFQWGFSVCHLLVLVFFYSFPTAIILDYFISSFSSSKWMGIQIFIILCVVVPFSVLTAYPPWQNTTAYFTHRGTSVFLSDLFIVWIPFITILLLKRNSTSFYIWWTRDRFGSSWFSRRWCLVSSFIL